MVAVTSIWRTVAASRSLVQQTLGVYQRIAGGPMKLAPVTEIESFRRLLVS